MAKEYITLLEQKEDLGFIALNKGVFETITLITINDIKDVYLPAETAFYQPVNCNISKNELHITVDAKMQFGANVAKISEEIQEKVYQTILQMTGFRTIFININVIGFVF